MIIDRKNTSIQNSEFLDRHYALLASAIAGRSVAVHWHGNAKYSSYTDNHSIFLPTHEAGRSHLYDVIAQAALLRNGAYQRKYVARLTGRRGALKRYAITEIVRFVHQYSDIMPRRFCELIEISNFPYRTECAEQSLELAKSGKPFPEIPVFVGSPRPLLLARNNILDISKPDQSPHKSSAMLSSTSTDQLDFERSQSSKDSKASKVMKNSIIQGGRLSEILRAMLGMGQSTSLEETLDNGGAEATSVGRIAQPQNTGAFSALADKALDLVAEASNIDVGSKRYPEWDSNRRIYRKNWVLVDEVDPWDEEPMPLEQMHEVLSAPPTALKRKLAGIGLGFEWHQNQQEGDDYVMDRLVDHIIDCRRGAPLKEDIYQRLFKTRRELAVLVLLDVSSSTADVNDQGETIHRQQIRTAYHLMQILHDLGDQIAVYGFHSWGRLLVRLLRIKSFGERIIPSVIQKRLTHLRPSGFTRYGAALRCSADKLINEARVPYRLLVVITDGIAYDHDYQGKYAEEDTKKALEEIRAQGTSCLCLMIGSGQDHDTLRDVFGSASTLAINDYEQLHDNIRQVFLDAVRQLAV